MLESYHKGQTHEATKAGTEFLLTSLILDHCVLNNISHLSLGGYLVEICLMLKREKNLKQIVYNICIILSVSYYLYLYITSVISSTALSYDAMM